MSLRDRVRPGVFKHVILQSWLDKRYGKEDLSVKSMAKESLAADGGDPR